MWPKPTSRLFALGATATRRTARCSAGLRHRRRLGGGGPAGRPRPPYTDAPRVATPTQLIIARSMGEGSGVLHSAITDDRHRSHATPHSSSGTGDTWPPWHSHTVALLGRSFYANQHCVKRVCRIVRRMMGQRLVALFVALHVKHEHQRQDEEQGKNDEDHNGRDVMRGQKSHEHDARG